MFATHKSNWYNISISGITTMKNDSVVADSVVGELELESIRYIQKHYYLDLHC